MNTGVEIDSQRTCHGKACEMTIAGMLTLENQAEVMRRVRASLSCVNTALVDVTSLVVQDGAHNVDPAPWMNDGCAMYLIATVEQIADYAVFMDDRTGKGERIAIFPEHLREKADIWLKFSSRLGI